MNTLALAYLVGLAFLITGTAIRDSDHADPASTFAGLIVGTGIFLSAIVLAY